MNPLVVLVRAYTLVHQTIASIMSVGVTQAMGLDTFTKLLLHYFILVGYVSG